MDSKTFIEKIMQLNTIIYVVILSVFLNLLHFFFLSFSSFSSKISFW